MSMASRGRLSQKSSWEACLNIISGYHLNSEWYLQEYVASLTSQVALD